MDLTEPLTEAEFEDLEQFLLSDNTPDECLDLSGLDGFLTAIVTGPTTLLPSRWLPALWGEADGDKVQWDNPQHAERITGMVMRHMNGIIAQVTDFPDEFEPLIYEREHDGETIPIIDEWCWGYVRGVLLDAENWSPLLQNDEHSLLTPILLYGTEEGFAQLNDKPELAERHNDIAEMLPSCVVAIRDFWLPYRKLASTVRHKTPPTGRNDPCLCGSGKKFKKCCGGQLH